jgi:nitrogen fixation NifU-like protein
MRSTAPLTSSASDANRFETEQATTMPGLEDLYREIILDHYRTPRNRGELPTPPAVVAQGHNPLCGDEITVFLQLDGDTVSDVKVGGQGCSISQSSASMMSQAIKGHSVDEVRALVKRFKGMMSIEDADGDGATEPASDVSLGDLEALQGVVKFPVRIKCATLAWNTLTQGLDEIDA